MSEALAFLEHQNNPVSIYLETQKHLIPTEMKSPDPNSPVQITSLHFSNNIYILYGSAA